MILVNSFEKRFGNLYGKGVWSKLGKRAATIDRNVVALASFNGEHTTMWYLLNHLCFDYN